MRFGITETDYEALEEKQGGLCLICKESCSRGFRLSIDHDHKTGRIRGLLCNACNIGLGSFRDNPDLLRRAAEYLE